MDALYVARNLSSSSTMDRFNLNKYRQRNPQSSTIGGSRSGSSVPHAESQPVASTSKLPPLQNGQSVPPFQQHPSGKNRVEPPQTRVSSSHHASTLSHQQFDDPYTQKASTSALPQQVRDYFFCFQCLQIYLFGPSSSPIGCQPMASTHTLSFSFSSFSSSSSSSKNSSGCATPRFNKGNYTIGSSIYHKVNSSYITNNSSSNYFTRSNLIDVLLALAMPWSPTPTHSPLRLWTHLQIHLWHLHLRPSRLRTPRC